MAYTQADIDAVRALIVAGRQGSTIRHGETSVQYQNMSLRELRELLREMEAAVAGRSARPRRTVARFSNGC